MSVSLFVLICWISLLFLPGVCGIPVTRRDQSIQQSGRNRWVVNEVLDEWNPSQIAIIVVDMWNEHWCPSMTESVKSLAPLINDTLNAARSIGISIVHAPSDCESYYQNNPARVRTLNLPNSPIQAGTPRYNPSNPAPPFPLDADGCDVINPNTHQPYTDKHIIWTHETDLITIHTDTDYIIHDSDGAQTLWNLIQAKNLKALVYVGVASNMCIMGRNFGIQRTTAWIPNYIYRVALAREGTDVMYDPKTNRPYCERHDALQLMQDYIEKFWAESVSIYDFFNAPGVL